MHNIVPGQTWAVVIDGQTRTVDVEDTAAVPGWWKCRDRETDIEFSAREHWFVTRVDADER